MHSNPDDQTESQQLAFSKRDHDATESYQLPKGSDSAYASSSRTIGPYKLLQQVGEGGMGEVWMAEQEKPVRRRVALKLIKQGLDNKQILARFEAERQALAMMDHQNIAKVLDAGTTEQGQPYFVMELVQGIPFTQYCNQHKLSIDERLELFIPVCKAVQHAHQKGIIHRDLKPSNVLVSLYDGKPVPKVIDFGLAKALQQQTRLTDKTMFTEFGQVVGTLQYMSPEQAEMNQLDIDTRTDIYSLGVMLYELLTGSTPINKETLKQQAILQVLETIRLKEPPRPSIRLSSVSNEAASSISEQRRIDLSKLKNFLRGELDWIVMKALEKDRTRRYETANGFAEDLNRYLIGDVVLARPPSTVYRLKKYVRRNKGLVASLTSIAILLIAGVITSSWFAIVANNAQREAYAKNAEAESEREKAESEREKAELERKRAEAAAVLAKEQAAASSRLADYTGSRYELSQGKLYSAFQLANSAYESSPAWEYGRQLAEIVNEARRQWQLVGRVTLSEKPQWASFLRGDSKSLVLGFPDRLEWMSIQLPRKTSITEIRDSQMPCPIDESHFAVVSKGAIFIVTLPELNIVAKIECSSEVESLRSSRDGKRLAVLLSNADVMVLSTSGVKLAERSFAEWQRKGFRPEVDLSPSGASILLHSGLHYADVPVWNWENDSITVIKTSGNFQAHKMRFAEEDVLVGLWSSTSVSEEVVLRRLEVSSNRQSSHQIGGVLYSADATLEGYSQGLNRAAIVADNAINLVEASRMTEGGGVANNIKASVTRYASLWPHSLTPIEFANFDGESRALALLADTELIVFVNSELKADQRLGFRSVETSRWSYFQTDHELYTYNRSQAKIYCLQTADLSSQSIKVAAPMLYTTNSGPRFFWGWGLTATPDGQLVAILWQENSGGSGIGSQYFRKIVRVYRLDKERKQSTLVSEFEMPEFEGIDGRKNRQFIFTPDGKTIAFCSEGQVVGYRISDGKSLYQFRSGNATFATHAKAGLFGVGHFDSEDNYRVYNLHDGKVIAEWKQDAPIRKAAFAPDGKSVYLGYSTDRLKQYRISDGKLISDVGTPVAPTAISPLGDRYLGFVADNNSKTNGSLVMADLHNGRVIEVLNPASHVLNAASFDHTGKMISLCERDKVIAMRTISPEEAVQALELVLPFPER